MERKDFTLKNINHDLEQRLKGSGLDFCKMLVQAYEQNLSVTAKYDPPQEYVTLGKGDETQGHGYYYGVSPCLDGRELVRGISQLEWQTPEALSAYIEAHGHWFMARPHQQGYLPALARYIVVCMASHYGLRIAMEPEQYAQLKETLMGQGYARGEVDAVVSYQSTWGTRPFAVVRGCPTEELMACLEQFQYQPTVIAPRQEGRDEVEAWEVVAPSQGVDIRQVYAQGVELMEGRVFYSGVLIKPTLLEMVKGPKENENICSLSIHFERSTYGTVCALDRNLTCHPLLRPVKSEVVAMLQQDDREKRALRDRMARIEGNQLEEGEAYAQMIAAVNQYLSGCINVNQMGVSANIVTGDGTVLLGQRSPSNIDAGKLYPGVNGNAEVADANVSFYSQSVYEDYPTINLDDQRMDFFGEISREAYGEMRVNFSKQEWICYGLTLSGNMPGAETGPDSYVEPYRRMHFNLIFQHNTDKTMEEIEKRSVTAAEAFETKGYLGFQIKCEKNWWAHLGRAVIQSIVNVVNQKDFIEAAGALILFLLTTGHLVPGDVAWSQVTVGDGFAMAVSLLIVMVTFWRTFQGVCRFFRRRKKVRVVRIYAGMSYHQVNQRAKAALRVPGGKGELYPYHPAAYACLRAYIDHVIYDSFFPKDRR